MTGASSRASVQSTCFLKSRNSAASDARDGCMATQRRHNAECCATEHVGKFSNYSSFDRGRSSRNRPAVIVVNLARDADGLSGVIVGDILMVSTVPPLPSDIRSLEVLHVIDPDHRRNACKTLRVQTMNLLSFCVHLQTRRRGRRWRELNSVRQPQT
jgi:hypothetical protein